MAADATDPFSSELDRIEQLLAHKDAELQRLRTELALKTLYIDELQATLESQARELEAFDLPGTVIRSELRSPTGGLTAYRVRDTLIALREDQAAQIQIEPVPESAS